MSQTGYNGPSAGCTRDEDPRIPVRLDPWPLNFGRLNEAVDATRLEALRAAVAEFDDKAVAALNYVDGGRSISQIARLVAGELDDFDPAHATAWFDCLAAGGVITWRGGEQ